MKVLTLIAAFLMFITAGYTQTSDSSISGIKKDSMGYAPVDSAKLYSKNASATHLKIAPWFVDRFKITAGFFRPTNNTTIQVGVNGGAMGTSIDFEKDLGINSQIGTFLASAQWRISRRSRINLSYYDIRRSSTHTLQRDITFEDNTYPVNASVNTYFNTAIYQFSYGYAILAKPRYELGVLIGAHIVGVSSQISLAANNVGASTSNNFGFTAPLPDLGIWGGYAISDRFAVNLDADYLALTVDNTSGRLIAYNLAVTYKLIKQLDLSLGYTGLNFKVNTTKKNANGSFKWGYNGPVLAATFSFGKSSWGH